MKRISAVLTLTASVTFGLMGAGAADAAPSPVVLATVQDGAHPPHTPPTGTFRAIGLDGCPSGSYVDSLVSFSPDGTRVVVDEIYSCIGGAAFTARLALHIAVTAADHTQGVRGTWRIIASDNGLAGSGALTGRSTGCSPVGAVFAECTGGSGLIFGEIRQ